MINFVAYYNMEIWQYLLHYLSCNTRRRVLTWDGGAY